MAIFKIILCTSCEFLSLDLEYRAILAISFLKNDFYKNRGSHSAYIKDKPSVYLIIIIPYLHSQVSAGLASFTPNNSNEAYLQAIYHCDRECVFTKYSFSTLNLTSILNLLITNLVSMSI